MSTGQVARHRARSNASKRSATARHTPPPTALTPENTDQEFEPCAATASFLLYAQRNVILVLHHDTLAIERRFDLHREDVLWIQVDDCSERGAGRLAVSYDAGNTAIVWDILTGGEVARFSAYERMRVARFIRNGNIAFGNDQGNIILFEPSTSEHISSRTIYDPITALAPSSDCRTFAIGYLNGSILIATLQPSFTIQHTLTTTRAPSRISGLSWHGSSSKQKTDMLATQTAEGDLRVWSVPKVPHQEAPAIIRVLQRSEGSQPGPCWFAWSRNGRIVQHADGETRSWDVRTKKVTFEVLPTIDGITAITNYGPTATLFTLGRNNTVQQYDVTPGQQPMQVASVRHVPSNTPPTPPSLLDDLKITVAQRHTGDSTAGPMFGFGSEADSSADESGALSPLQKIAQELDSLDALESEIRDKVMPLSPVSSQASSVSSRSSGRSRRARKYLYDRPDSSSASTTTGADGTEFSFGSAVKPHHQSVSIQSVSSFASRSHYRTSNLRQEVMRSPDETQQTAAMELFPFTKARMRDVPFRTPHYGNVSRTPDLLRREMLSVVFGWNDDIRRLVQDEQSRHRPGSASAVLLAKWLGDMGADSMAAMVGSESMTSSDWMLLALSSIGQDSQKKVGEAFVQRLLEKGDIHPAVAILLGLGEHDDAIEVYVSQGYWMEAVLLTCLVCQSDWGRQSYLLRKWGEAAVQQGQAEVAVRCFSCTSVETSEPWFSPRAQQDAEYAAAQRRFADPSGAASTTSPPISPPSRSASGRLTAKNASLKLITTFGEKGVPAPNGSQVGGTPIAESALSPGSWRQAKDRATRETSTARTATPGGYSRRKRLPSKSDIERAKQEAAELATPITAARDLGPRLSGRARSSSQASSIPEPETALRPAAYDAESLALRLEPEGQLPSMHGPFARLREQSRQREAVHDRKPDGLAVQIVETSFPDNPSPSLSTGNESSLSNARTTHSRTGASSPSHSMRGRAIDDYINSVEEARNAARERVQSKRRGESQRRDESRAARGVSRARDSSTTRGKDKITYIKPGKRSPSSPKPMSAGEIAQANYAKTAQPATSQDEDFYKIASPVDAHDSRPGPIRSDLMAARAAVGGNVSDFHSRPSDDGRGRSELRVAGSTARSPSSPLPMSDERNTTEKDEVQSDGQRFRIRARSSSRRGGDDLQSRRAQSRSRRDRSSSRKPRATEDSLVVSFPETTTNSILEEQASGSPMSVSTDSRGRAHGLTRKELAAKELEERRMSLARRPSVPAIPLPSDLQPARPGMAPRSHTELGDSPISTQPPLSRSHTVDPEEMSRPYKVRTGPTFPAMGLPATPRAMRHPRYLSTDPNEREGTPPVPEIPGTFSELSSLAGSLTGSSLSQVTGSSSSHVSSLRGQRVSSSLQSVEHPQETEVDEVGPLLPSTVFGQTGPQAPTRSASAPPEKMGAVHHAYKTTLPPSNRRLSGGRGHVRKISPPEPLASSVATSNISSIDEALHTDQSIVIVPEDPEDDPPVLPELQHLAGPPPPPPPPTMFHANDSKSGLDFIDIVMNPDTVADGSLSAATLPQPMHRATTASPSLHRRGRGSVSESIGSRFKTATDRMRSQSRSRVKSPPMPTDTYKPAPYETQLPPMPSYHLRKESLSRAQSPYEQAMSAGGPTQRIPIPPPPPPPPGSSGVDGKLVETTVPPANFPSALPPSRSQSAAGWKREVRANMPPDTLQQGVYTAGGFL